MALGYGNSYGLSYGLADPTSLLIPYDMLLPYPYQSVNATTGNLPLGSSELVESLEIVSGTMDVNLPTAALTINLTGTWLPSFFDDFYNRIHVTPDTVDFGIVVTDTTLQIQLWNAYLSNSQINVIDETLLIEADVDIDEPALPQTMLPLEVKTLNITASLTGKTDITGSSTFIFTPSQTVEVPVAGSRGRLLPFLPNWASPVRESWEYKTEILTARSGREQRRALRDTPRKAVEFTAHVYGDQRRELNALLDKYHHVDVVIPDMPRHILATSAVPTAAGGTFTVDSLPDWLVDGAIVCLVYGKQLAMRYVDTVDSLTDTVTLKDVGTEEFPAGCYVCFGFVGNLENTIQTRRLTNDVVEVAFRFKAKPGREDIYDLPAAPTTYNNREVFTHRPNWADPVGLEFERLTDEIDYSYGVVSRFTPQAFGARTFQASFSNRSYANTKLLLDIFRRAKGRRGEFYMPTWENDLPLKLSVSSGGSSFRVNGTTVSDAYYNNATHKSIAVILKNGNVLYRTVTNIFEVDDVNGNDSILQLSATWPYAIAPSDVLMICWMPCCRFASDAITIEWLTDSKARLQMAIRTTEDLTPET